MEFKNELQILNSCFACLRHSEDSLQILRDITTDLESVTIVALLTKYFWFHQDDFNADHVLCRNCWNRLDEFHRFYLEVEGNHCSLNLATPEVSNYEVRQERKAEPLEPVQVEVKVEDLEEFEEEASDEEFNAADDCLSDEELSEKNESEPEEIKPKRKYTKRIKTEEPVVKRKANYQVKNAKQLAEEDDIIKKHVQYICEACGSNCPTFTQLQKHMTNVHGMKGRWWLQTIR